MADCIVDKQNLGLVKCNKIPQLLAGMIEVPANFEISELELADATVLQAALLAAGSQRAYLWPPFDSFENASEEAVYEETPLNDLAVRPGKYRWRFGISRALCLHRAMYSHSGKGMRLILIDIAGNFILTKKSNGMYTGFTLSLLNVEKMIISDGSISTKTPVYVVLKNTIELDQNGYMFDGSAYVSELVSITDVTLDKPTAPVPPADSAVRITVQVLSTCDGTPISGLVAADFVLTDAAGDPQPITSVAEVNGVYTLTGVGFESGNLTLKPAATLTIEGYETTDTLAIVIA